jgi:hypothetical protein
MPVSWGFNPNNASQPQSQTPLKRPEIKFQISLKARLGGTYFYDRLKFYAAYTIVVGGKPITNALLGRFVKPVTSPKFSLLGLWERLWALIR